MTTPSVPRRTFLTRVLGALAGGAWLGGGAGKAAAATTQSEDAPYLGEVRMFAGYFEPNGWRFCDGQLLDITQYESLWNLIGTTYGGDGQTTFALPDLRGRAPIHVSTTQLAEMTGQESVSLAPAQHPVHSHGLQASSALGISDDPAGRVPAKNAMGSPHYSSAVDTSLASTTLVVAGGSEGHNNMMPSLCIHFIICIEGGVFPSEV